MPDYTNTPGFQSLMQHPKVQKMSPEKRQEFLGLVNELPQDEFDQLTQGLRAPAAAAPRPFRQPSIWETFSTPKPSNAESAAEEPMSGKEAAATAIDMIGQTGGAYLLGQIGAPTTGAVLGSLAANQINKAAGFRPGKALSLDTSDLAAVAVPAAFGAVGAIGRGLLKPAKTAIETADATNAANQDIYDTAVGNFEKGVKSHQEALQEVPAAARREIKVGDYKASYGASEAAGKGTKPVDLSDFQDAAKSVGVDLQRPAEPLQARRYVHLAEALGDFGAPKEAAESAATSNIVDPYGQPLKNTVVTPGAAEGEPIGRVIATHARLGSLLSKLYRSRGPELGATKELYAALTDTLKEAGKQDPGVAQAVGNYLEGNADFRKSLAMQDYMNLFKVGRGYTNKPGVGKEVKTGSILNNFENLRDNDRLFKTSFSPEELQFLEENLKKLPTERIPAQPGEPPEPVRPDVGPFPLGKAILGKSIGGSLLGGYLAGPLGYPIGAAAGASTVALPYWVSEWAVGNPEREAIVRSILTSKTKMSPQATIAAITSAAKALGAKEEPDQ